MAHEKAKGQQAEKLFLGSLREIRAIKNLKIAQVEALYLAAMKYT